VALELLAGMCREVGGSTIGYNACISVCARGQAWSMACRLLEDMPEKRVQPDTVSFNATISAASEGARWQPALGLFDQMTQERVPHDLVSFNATMDACAMSGEWRPALSLLRAAGVQANLVSFNTALTACHRGSAWAASLELFALLQRRNLRPDTLSYNVMMSVGHKSARWPLALQMLRSLHHHRLAPSDRSAGAVVSACERAEQWELALELFQGLGRASVQTSPVVFNAALSACAKGAQWENAMQLYRSLQRSLRPDEVSRNSLLCALAAAARWEEREVHTTRQGERASQVTGVRTCPDVFWRLEPQGLSSSACDPPPAMAECHHSTSNWAASGIFERKAALQLPKLSSPCWACQLSESAQLAAERRGPAAVPPAFSLALGIPWAVCLGLRKRSGGGKPARASITRRRVETGGRIRQRKRPQDRPDFGFLQEARWERFRRRVAALLLAFAVLAAAFGGCMSNSRARLLQSRLEQGGQTEFVYNEATPFRQARLVLSRASLPAVASPSEIPSPWHEGTGFVSDTAHLLRSSTVQRSLGARSTSWRKRSAARREQRWRWSP
ncbi:unnamed protein product, partial [Symbiodinium necroappetens]